MQDDPVARLQAACSKGASHASSQIIDLPKAQGAQTWQGQCGLFTEFQGGHWLSLFNVLWPAGSRPPMQIRTQTGDVAEGTALDTTLPAGAMTTAGFYAKLLAAWIAMGFKVPKVDVPHKIAP